MLFVPLVLLAVSVSARLGDHHKFLPEIGSDGKLISSDNFECGRPIGALARSSSRPDFGEEFRQFNLSANHARDCDFGGVVPVSMSVGTGIFDHGDLAFVVNFSLFIPTIAEPEIVTRFGTAEDPLTEEEERADAVLLLIGGTVSLTFEHESGGKVTYDTPKRPPALRSRVDKEVKDHKDTHTIAVRGYDLCCDVLDGSECTWHGPTAHACDGANDCRWMIESCPLDVQGAVVNPPSGGSGSSRVVTGSIVKAAHKNLPGGWTVKLLFRDRWSETVGMIRSVVNVPVSLLSRSEAVKAVKAAEAAAAEEQRAAAGAGAEDHNAVVVVNADDTA